MDQSTINGSHKAQFKLLQGHEIVDKDCKLWHDIKIQGKKKVNNEQFIQKEKQNSR